MMVGDFYFLGSGFLPPVENLLRTAEKSSTVNFVLSVAESEKLSGRNFGVFRPPTGIFPMFRRMLRMPMYLEVRPCKNPNKINVVTRFWPLRISRLEVQVLLGAPTSLVRRTAARWLASGFKC
jgi:hypothetical protein